MKIADQLGWLRHLDRASAPALSVAGRVRASVAYGLLPAVMFTFLVFLHVPAVAVGQSDRQACLAASPNGTDVSALMSLVETCTATLSWPLSDADRAADLIQRGVAFRNLGHLEKSLADLSEALHLDDRNVTALKMKAWTLREMHRPAESIPLYDRAIALAPDAQAYLSRCAARTDLRLFDEAVHDCEEADRRERSTDSLFFLALSLSGAGRTGEALMAANKMLLYQPLWPQHYLLLADLQERNGDRNSARDTVMRAAELYPDDDSIADLLRRLNSP